MSSSSPSSPSSSSGSLVRFVVTAVVVACLAVPTTLVVAAGVAFWRSAVEAQVARGQQVAATTATLMAVARESGSAADLAVATAFVRAVISEAVEAVVVLDASQAVVTSAVGPRFADAAAAVQALGTSGVQSGGVVVDATIMERERGTEVQRPGGRVLVGLKRPSVPLRLMVGFAIVGVAAAAGMALVVVALLRRRALRPLSAVTRGLQAVAGGAVDAAAVAVDQVRTPGQRPLKEIEALLDAFDALVRGEKERQRLVTRLEQGMGPQVAHDHQAFERAPTQQEVAVVVVDVRDFTALQASLSPELAVGFIVSPANVGMMSWGDKVVQLSQRSASASRR